MKSIFVLSLLICLLGTSQAKSWSDLTSLFPGSPGQPTDYLGTGTFRLADFAIPPSVDGSDGRFTYDENLVLKFEHDGSHRLEFLVNYADSTELGSILYPAQLFAPFLEASVQLDRKNHINLDVGCLFNLNSLPDIFVGAFWDAVTATGTPMHFVDVRDYRGLRCDYFEGVIPGDGNTVPDTTVGWYNRWTSDTVIEKYAPVQYFLGPAEFEQSLGYPSPSFQKKEDHLTRLLSDFFPATWLCQDITTPFLHSGTLPSKREIPSPLDQAHNYLRKFI
jgi:hypothetical protein